MYRRLIDSMLDLYGRECIVQPFGSQFTYMVKAFINPMRYKYNSFGEIAFVEQGVFDERLYRYIGNADEDLGALPQGSVIRADGRAYRVDSSDIYYFAGLPLYCRAILKLYKGGDEQ